MGHQSMATPVAIALFYLCVIDSPQPSTGRRILALGADVFVSRTFAEGEIANPQPGLKAGSSCGGVDPRSFCSFIGNRCGTRRCATAAAPSKTAGFDVGPIEGLEAGACRCRFRSPRTSSPEIRAAGTSPTLPRRQIERESVKLAATKGIPTTSTVCVGNHRRNTTRMLTLDRFRYLG